MYAIDKFCKNRKIPKNIKDAFTAYCKASISTTYNIGGGETLTGLLIKFTEKEIEEKWLEFVNDLKLLLSKEDHAG